MQEITYSYTLDEDGVKEIAEEQKALLDTELVLRFQIARNNKTKELTTEQIFERLEEVIQPVKDSHYAVVRLAQKGFCQLSFTTSDSQERNYFIRQLANTISYSLVETDVVRSSVLYGSDTPIYITHVCSAKNDIVDQHIY